MKFDTFLVISKITAFFLFVGGGTYLLAAYGDADPKTLKDIVLSSGTVYLITAGVTWLLNEIEVF